MKSDSANGSEVKSLSTAILVLESLGSAKHPITASELAAKLGMTVPRIWRYLATLCRLGLVEKLDTENRYCLSWELYRLGQLATSRHPIVFIAQSYLQDLRNKYKYATILLLMPTEAQPIIVNGYQALTGTIITVRKGGLIPILSTSAGRVILAFQPIEQRKKLLKTARANEEKFPVAMSQAKFTSLLKKIKERHYDFSSGLRGFNINAVSVPVFGTEGEFTAVITAVANASLLPLPPEPELLADLMDYSNKITTEL